MAVGFAIREVYRLCLMYYIEMKKLWKMSLFIGKRFSYSVILRKNGSERAMKY